MSDRQTSPRRSSGTGCFIFALLTILLLSIGINVLLVVVWAGKGAAGMAAAASSSTLENFTEEVLEPGTSNEKIAVIEIKGVISNDAPGAGGDSMVKESLELLRHAADDSMVKAIVLYIDSPGGEVTASDVIYNEVRRIKQEVKKPVVVYMGSLAASGGYYIACGGEYLMANETTLTGSIGVIIQTLNYEELFGKVGLEAMTFKSGKFKDMLSGSREMTPEEREYVNYLVMQMYEKFLGIVATERGLNADTLRNTLADGRIISAIDAKEGGLIDATGYLEDAYAEARKRGRAPGAKVVRYEAYFNLSRALRMFGEAKDPGVNINIGQNLVPQLKPGYCYYLWMPSSDVAR